MKFTKIQNLFLLSIVTILISLQGFSQSSVKGNIIDSETQEIIPYATIRLLKSDSLITGTLSGENGDFVLENILGTNFVL